MDKLDHLQEDLHGILQSARDPVLCWSGGKDSTFLLLLAKKLNYNLPVLMFSHFWTRRQKEFIKEIIQKHEVTAFFYRPTRLEYIKPYVVAQYSVGNSEMPVIFDHFHNNTRCGLDLGAEVLQGPYPLYLWDITLTGSKKSDSHPLLEKLDFENFQSSTQIVCPLWDWTDEEVIEATATLGFDFNFKAYQDEEYDTGNFIACMNCQDVGEVYCPKLGKTIQGIGC